MFSPSTLSLTARSIPTHAQRSITYSSTTRRALPFALSAQRSSVKDDESSARVLRMLMIGKPGAGKGTLSARLVKKYDILTISTGDLLRQHIKERTDVGVMAESIMARGGLLPDDVVLKIMTSKLDSLHNKHWILDGFPRTLTQGELLDAHLKKQRSPLTLVVNLDVPDDIILSRISDRWVHLASGRVYNIPYNPPKVDGFDDVTGEPLTKRPDDNPEIFARRLQTFYASTAPLLLHYAKSASSPANVERNPHQHPHQLSLHRPHKLKLKTLSGTTSDEIWPQLDQLVRNSFPSLKERVETAEMRRWHTLNGAITADDIHNVDTRFTPNN